jgi:hypothetical protein
MVWILIFTEHAIQTRMSANKLIIGVNNMLPARKFFGQNFMPDFFGDLF